MQMSLRKWTKVIIVLLAGAYLFVGVASLMHFHRDSFHHNHCPLCTYHQNCQYQELPCQPFVIEFLLFQTFSLSEPAVSHTKAVFHNETSRAPPPLPVV
jgi:hypothetical protein